MLALSSRSLNKWSLLGHMGNLGLDEDSSFTIYVSRKSNKVVEIMCVGSWVMEFLMTCWKSSTKAAMKAELFAGPAGRGTSTEVASHTSEDCVTFFVWGGHWWRQWSTSQKSIRTWEKKKGKIMAVYKWSTKLYTLQINISSSTFLGIWKNRLNKFFPPNYDFPVVSKWNTRVSERGLDLLHEKAIKLTRSC